MNLSNILDTYVSHIDRLQLCTIHKNKAKNHRIFYTSWIRKLKSSGAFSHEISNHISGMEGS